MPVFPPDTHGVKTRVACGKAPSASVIALPQLMGGSGDLDPSTNTTLKDQGDFERAEIVKTDHQGAGGGVWGYAGRIIHYGVREHAMGTVSNGLALHGGIRPFASTFLTFSDYMRPADANETVEAWRFAIKWRRGPIALILTRQNVPTIDRTHYASAKGVHRGAYILAESKTNPRIFLIATGSEVQHALGAHERLERCGVTSRVISMPSRELFELQPVSYRDSVLPWSIKKRIVIEAAASLGWNQYAGDEGLIISIDRFGTSAPGATNMKQFGFTADHVFHEALKLLEL